MGGAWGVGLATLVSALWMAAPIAAQSTSPTINLALPVGDSLHVALDQTIRVTKVGEPVTGILVKPVYAYDRVVLPVGSVVHGHIARLIDPPGLTRIRAAMGGNVSVARQVVLEFDSLVVGGESVAIHTRVVGAAERVRRQVASSAEGPRSTSILGRAEAVAKDQVRETIAEVRQKEEKARAVLKDPGKVNRVKEALFNELPYHPQYLHQGTVYTAELEAPISFGNVTGCPRARAGTPPAPDSVLTARLLTPLTSASASRGTPVTAVLTEPVLSGERELILPEGALLEGEVTFVTPASRWHRNGQLRFLLERVRVQPDDTSAEMTASLYSVDASENDRLAIDDEGGVQVNNTKTRFIAPALAVLALRGTLDQEHHHLDNDGDARPRPGPCHYVRKLGQQSARRILRPRSRGHRPEPDLTAPRHCALGARSGPHNLLEHHPERR